MKPIIKSLTIGLLSFMLVTNAVTAETLNLTEKLPIDPDVTIGKFDNGLTYYIRANKKPENRAEVRLVVNAGSVLESENQQGFAHLGEHMAFNGTKNFEKQELINYLESIGMKFGPEVNAYTSFDEVVYMLQLPTDSLAQFEKGIQILEDWAHLVSYEEEEIDKERGVVIEEWRLGQGAYSRMRDKYFPILFRDSQYAKRLPIGKIEILEADDNDAVRKFYKDWYRPDLFAVVAVGDFDPVYVKALIEKHFSGLKAPEAPPERTMFQVPDHEETLYAITTDKEAPRTSIAVYYKRDVKDMKVIGDYRESLVERLYNQMFSNRLDELRRQADPPFLYGSSASGRFVRTKDVYYLGAGVKEDGIIRGLDALYTEALRVKKYGFVASELERAKISMLRGYERAYTERDKTESSRYAREYVNNFLENETIPGIENEFNYAKIFLPEITIDEVNALIGSFITDDNKVVLVQMPEKEGVPIPTETELAAVMNAAMEKDILPYEDNVSDEPLLATTPKPGTIIDEKYEEDIDVHIWKLSNGANIVLKSTDFKNDEILFSGKSWGGSSLGLDEDWISLRSASAIVNQSGWGAFDAIALRNKLSGKIANVYAGIGELQESMSGNASPKDIETLFQLIYLAFTAPRTDVDAFQSYQARVKGYLENQGAMPESVFADSIAAVMSSYHPRRMPFKMEDLAEMDLAKMVEFYKTRYANGGDFTFYFVGNFDIDNIKPMVLTYLGGLPGIDREETWRDVNVKAPQGRIERTIKKGVEPKARVRLIFTGDYEFNRQNNYNIYALRDVLNIKLREVIREDKSGTYGIRMSASVSDIPKEKYNISISFGCAPDRVQELTNTVHQVLDSVKTYGIEEKYIAKVKEADLRSYETDLKKNSYWMSKLEQADRLNWERSNILTLPDLVNKLDKETVQEAAKKYFDGKNVATFILLPEE